jgi:hypothetical protein
MKSQDFMAFLFLGRARLDKAALLLVECVRFSTMGKADNTSTVKRTNERNNLSP